LVTTSHSRIFTALYYKETFHIATPVYFSLILLWNYLETEWMKKSRENTFCNQLLHNYWFIKFSIFLYTLINTRELTLKYWLTIWFGKSKCCSKINSGKKR
jgi:hypothetical protein